VFVVSSAAPAAAVDEPAPVIPSAAPVDEAPAPAPIADPAIPAAAVSALSQSALVDQRLAADGAALAASLSARSPSTAEIARSLRALASNAAFGDRIAPDIGTWSVGSPLSSGLVELYADVGRTAREGLSASLNNRAAYVAAGRAMLAVLADLPELDAAARVLAGSIDLELVPLDLPTGS
jgi:hypothetical protein